jgi:DNA-binding NarL/FixJ family response regulator
MRMPELRKERGLPTHRPAVSGFATPHMANSLNAPIRIRPVTVLLADDAEFARNAVKAFSEASRKIELVGEAHNFPQTLAMCSELKPCVVSLDLHMPGEALEPRHVKSKLLGGSKFVIAMCTWNDEPARALASRYGAMALLDKTQLASKLIPAIRAATG